MSQSPTFSPVAASRALMRTARTAALATLDAATGSPFASLVSVATAPDGTPLMLLSTLAAHTRNFVQDGRASLLIDDRSSTTQPDALAGSRLTLVGRVVKCDKTEEALGEAIARRRFLARHPEAEGYAGFRDFALYALTLETAHLVAGFGRINDLSAADLLVDLTGADDLIAAEPDILEHMNADHAETTRRYATQLLRQPEADWRVIGCDPDGLDLAAECNGTWRDARLVFPRPVRAAGPLRAILKELADQTCKTKVL